MDLAEQLRILETAKGNDALLALATVDLAHFGLSASVRARVKEALFAAAIPHWCDGDFLSALLDTTTDESEVLLGHLKALTVVEPFQARGEGTINVHETSRLALREFLRTTDAERWCTLSARARSWVARNTESHTRIEALYHHFATDQHAAAEECEALDREFLLQGRPETRSALALSLVELVSAGWLTGAALVEARLTPLWVRNERGETARLEAEARQVANWAKTASHESGIGRTQCLLGDVLKTKGNLEDALAAFLETLAIFSRLAKVNPGNAGWQHDLAVAHSRIGDVHREQGKLDDALAVFREYLAISKRLAEMDVSHAGWQYGLAVAHSRIGDVLQAQGEQKDALDAFCEYLSISKQLAEADVGNAGWQRGLGVAHSRIGDVHQAQGNLDDALAAYRKYLEIFERLAEADPNNANWQRELALAHSKVGDIHQAQGNLDAALAKFRENLAISKRLAEEDMSNAGWQRGLALAHSNVGEIYLEQGHLDEALAGFRENLAISKQLAEEDASNADWQHDLALAHYRLGGFFLEMREVGKAQSSFRWAFKSMEKAVAMSPGNVAWQRDLNRLKRIIR